ncbi:hypothetical protein WJX75_005712 [Coccomyxa subellipsoidea]|uniref:ARM repeat-containing protein n=1 Tax=Coccomyxa subellipsoidea TaxID=248742 RepID=A0ABR2YW55_9CHLO
MPAQKLKSAPQKKGGQLAVPVPDRPPWVSDELWQRSQDTAQLVERLKALNGASTEPGCSQAEVAQLLRHQLQTTPEKQEEFLKQGIIEAAARHISGSSTIAAPAIGLLSTLAASSPAVRDALLTSKPSILPSLTAILSGSSPDTAGAAVVTLKTLAVSEDSCTKLMKGLSDWDFQGLSEVITSTDTIGSQGATEALPLLEALLCEPAPVRQPISSQQAGNAKPGSSTPAKPVPQAAKKGAGKGKVDGASHVSAAVRTQFLASALSAGNIMPMLLKVCGNGSLDVGTKLVGLRVAHALLVEDHTRAASQMTTGGGISAVVAVLSEQQTPVSCKAAAAAVLKAFLLPQQLPSASPGHSVVRSRPSIVTTNVDGSVQTAPAPALNTGPPAAAVSADAVLDEAMARIEEAHRAGALPPLLNLCNSAEAATPSTPITSSGVDVGTSEGAQPPPSKAKKGGSQAKGPEGADVAQSNALSCMRVMSLHDDCKVSIADSNGIAILLPFLTVKMDAVRWAARQTLLNMAMLPEVAETLERKGAPTYIHGMNLIRLRRSQPGRQGLAAATKLLAQLSTQLSAPPVRLPRMSG